MEEYSITYLRKMTDDMIIKVMGDFIRSKRLKKNYTQAQLAERAGVNRTTIRDLELGRRSSLITLIQVLRALDQLQALRNFKINKEISPLELAKLAAKERRRASGYDGDEPSKSDW